MENSQHQPALYRDKNLQIIFSITLVAVLGVASITPAFPKIAQSLHLSETQVAYLISVFTLPGIFLTPFAGILADRFGRKTVLIPALFLFGLAGFACFFTKDLFWLLVFRFFQGVGAAPLGSLNVTLIGDFFKGRQRTAAMGYNASVLSVGTALYPLIGGLLAGLAWNFPFLLPLVAIPAGLVALYFLDTKVLPKSPNLRNYLRDAWNSMKRKEVLGLFLVNILTFAILYGAFLSYFPFLLNDRFGLSAPQIGIFLSLSSISTAITSSQLGRMVRYLSEVNLMKIAFVLYFLVSVMMPLIHSLALYVLPVILFGVAQGMNIPSLQTLLVRLAPDEQRAIFMSMNGMVLRTGQTLGPLLIGLGFAFSGIEGAFYLAALLALLVLVLIFLLLQPLAENPKRKGATR